MKCTIPEISWHNRDPVLSLDVQPIINDNYYRLASGGTDSHVLIWHLKVLETGATTADPVCDLVRHQKAVNVVRWSPSGQYLASGDDDANIIIWHLKVDELAVMLDGDNGDKEKWNAFKVLRGHKEDVYDICWSPDSTKLISGSVDNTSIIWNLAKGTSENIMKDHKGFVQGVAWDPLGQCVATLCTDRVFRIFNETGKSVKCRTTKGTLPVPDTHPLHGQVVRYFHDDTLKTFFRRLDFSPDGNLIITPSGCLEMGGGDNKNLYTTYIFSINCLTKPVAILPTPGQYTVAARCCPILFELWPDGPDPIIALPYRMVIAVATRSSVILYDTQQTTPFGIISNIHYTRLTDLTWSSDGRLLAVSSTDGFCTLVTFEPNELGKQYVKEPEVIEDVPMVEEVETNVSIEKRPSFLDKWANKSAKKDTDAIDIELGKENKNLLDETPTKPLSTTPAKPIAVRRKPRGEQLNITQFLKSPKTPKQQEKVLAQPSLDDSVAQTAWNLDKDESKNVPVTNDRIIVIEDSSSVDIVTKPTQDRMELDTAATKTELNDEITKATNDKPEVLDRVEIKQDLSLEHNKVCDTANDNKTTVVEPIQLITHKKRIPLITLSSPKHKRIRPNSNVKNS